MVHRPRTARLHSRHSTPTHQARHTYTPPHAQSLPNARPLTTPTHQHHTRPHTTSHAHTSPRAHTPPQTPTHHHTPTHRHTTPNTRTHTPTHHLAQAYTQPHTPTHRRHNFHPLYLHYGRSYYKLVICKTTVFHLCHMFTGIQY